MHGSIISQELRTTGIHMIFIRMPEPRERATVSAIPRAAASTNEVDTEGISFLLWYFPAKSI